MISRRHTLLSLSATGLSLVTQPVLAADRPFLTKAGMRLTSCDNAGVLISSIEDRLTRVDDFVRAGKCQLSKSGGEGPFFICTDAIVGKDITADHGGQTLTCALRVTDESCTPIPGAIVDIWSCDAEGIYSGFSPGQSFGRGRQEAVTSTRAMRGVLATDADGIVEFDTIYPGFYPGRAIHIHFKAHVGNTAYLTSQALFPEDWNDKVMRTKPYSSAGNGRRKANNTDFAFNNGENDFLVFERSDRLISLVDLTIQS